MSLKENKLNTKLHRKLSKSKYLEIMKILIGKMFILLWIRLLHFRQST